MSVIIVCDRNGCHRIELPDAETAGPIAQAVQVSLKAGRNPDKDPEVLRVLQAHLDNVYGPAPEQPRLPGL